MLVSSSFASSLTPMGWCWAIFSSAFSILAPLWLVLTVMHQARILSHIESYYHSVINGKDEAKSYGRNRTFLLEESAPHPVVPPELPIEPRTLPLR